MKSVFGVPVGPLSFWLVALLAVSVGAVTVIAVRNMVFVKIGLRNVPRRRARSALIVVGLMLGTTIIASALLTGDTMATAVRASVERQLGVTDELVTAGTDAQTAVDVGLHASRPYFDTDAAVAAIDEAESTLPVDGVLAAIVEPVAAQNETAGRTEPDVTLFAPDPVRAGQFGFADVARLGAGRVLLNEKAAADLAASAGDTIQLFVGGRPVAAEVAGVGRYDGAGTAGAAVIVPLAAAQDLLGHAGQVNSVLVSNRGGTTAGAAVTSEVEPALDHVLAPSGLQAHPVKRDGLDAADASGNAFVQLFTTFGSFSMAAGILLIFLIFVMLAAERRPEMGMARAVGTQRRHLVQMFLYEGAAYDLAAAAIGAALGIAVSFVMVNAVARTFEGDADLHLTYSLSLRSLVIAYSIGVLLTLAVVTLSAWRVSRLNIVSAVRDLPEARPPGVGGRRLILSVMLVACGGLLAVAGASASAYLPWMLGLSMSVLASVPLVQRAGVPDRLAHTAAGGVLVLAWLVPFSVFDRLFGDMSMDFSVWVVGGLVVVIAATWLIIYNADLLLGAAGRMAAPFAAARPVARMAVAYPLRDRFRTGVVMAMFMLVVFTLVTGSTIPRAFTQSFDDVHRFGGGFDVQVTTASAAAVDDVRTVLPADVAADVTAAGAQSFVPLAAHQANGTSAPEPYPVRGVDDGFLDHTTYDLAAMADGYTSKQQVWAALAAHPGLAVVDPFVVPRRHHWGFAVLPAFQVHGFYVEDGTFRPVPVDAVDPLTGTTLHLTVIGVLSDSAPYAMSGITVGQATLAPFGDRARPSVHHLAVRPGADPDTVARRVEAALLDRGAEAKSYREILHDAVASSNVFLRLIQGFMALGLIVGVAALGVITARSAVERRQQIGVLRAIGFRREVIRRCLLAETSIVTLTAIAAGTVLGLAISYNVIADAGSKPGYENLTFTVPWAQLAIIFAAVIAASVLTTLAASHRATRIYPAAALRYQ
jgi:putative ABC transport system permease protein